MHPQTKRGQTPFLRTKQKKRAFTIIEMLISLSLLAMLVTAMAFAFDASVKNYHANQGIYKTVNTARQALLRITNDIRTAQAVQLVGTGPGEDPTDLSQCTIVLSEGTVAAYRFNAADNTLYYDKGGSSYTLCENVTAMTFARNTVMLPDNSTGVRSVRIVMTLTDDLGEVTQTLAAAALVRKNM